MSFDSFTENGRIRKLGNQLNSTWFCENLQSEITFTYAVVNAFTSDGKDVSVVLYCTETWRREMSIEFKLIWTEWTSLRSSVIVCTVDLTILSSRNLQLTKYCELYLPRYGYKFSRDKIWLKWVHRRQRDMSLKKNKKWHRRHQNRYINKNPNIDILTHHVTLLHYIYMREKHSLGG